MRFILISVVLFAVLVSSGPARADELTDQPWSTGFLLGVSTSTANSVTTAMFSMEIPAEYTFKVGPGFLVPHFGFMLSAFKNCVVIGLPFGIRYKFRIASVPLYVYPLFDIGPAFIVVNGASAVQGALRVGAGLSYYVHRYVELVFQPLGLGATFDANGGQFVWNFLMGLNIRF